MTAARGHCPRLGPVDFTYFFALRIFFQHRIAQFFHHADIAAKGIAYHWRMLFFGNDQSVVRYDKNGPAFVQEMEEFTDITVCLFVNHFNSVQIFSIIITQLSASFGHIPEIMPLRVHIVTMGEDHLILLLLNQMIQGFSLPFSIMIPRTDDQFFHQHWIFDARISIYRHIACIFHNRFIQTLRMPKHIFRHIQRFAQPQADFAAIGRYFKETHGTIAHHFLFIHHEGIQNRIHILIQLERHNRLNVLFRMIHRHMIIDTRFILQNQTWPSNQTIRRYDVKFLSTLRCIRPIKRIFNR